MLASTETLSVSRKETGTYPAIISDLSELVRKSLHVYPALQRLVRSSVDLALITRYFTGHLAVSCSICRNFLPFCCFCFIFILLLFTKPSASQVASPEVALAPPATICQKEITPFKSFEIHEPSKPPRNMFITLSVDRGSLKLHSFSYTVQTP